MGLRGMVLATRIVRTSVGKHDILDTTLVDVFRRPLLPLELLPKGQVELSDSVFHRTLVRRISPLVTMLTVVWAQAVIGVAAREVIHEAECVAG